MMEYKGYLIKPIVASYKPIVSICGNGISFCIFKDFDSAKKYIDKREDRKNERN